jgi:hypothetical protein
MSKTFRAWKIDQPLLLPLAVQDFVAPGHLARFVLALIVDELDLIEIVAAYSNEKGQPPFQPAYDDGAAALCLLARHLFFAPHRPGLP